jgi:small subunit ribosomal protein S18
MSRHDEAAPATSKNPLIKTSGKGVEYVDYKDVESLRRLMTANGKIHGRKRNSTNARQQKMVAAAIKRARFIGLLPFTDATL